MSFVCWSARPASSGGRSARSSAIRWRRPSALASAAAGMAPLDGSCVAMRLVLKLYITLVCAVTALLFGRDLSVLTLWPHSWSAAVAIALIVLSAIGDHLQFEVRR